MRAVKAAAVQVSPVLYSRGNGSSIGDSQMKIIILTHRTFLALAVCAVIGVGGVTLAQQTGKGQVKVTHLSQPDIFDVLRATSRPAARPANLPR